MKAEQLMVRDVRTCSADDTLHSAAHSMWQNDVGCLVVVDAHRHPVGMITDRDVAMAAYTKGVALGHAPVSSAMSQRLFSCTPDSSLSDVQGIMQDAQIRRLPVVGSRGELVGLITLGDLAHSAVSSTLHMAAAPAVVRTLAAVTEQRWSNAETRAAQ